MKDVLYELRCLKSNEDMIEIDLSIEHERSLVDERDLSHLV